MEPATGGRRNGRLTSAALLLCLSLAVPSLAAAQTDPATEDRSVVVDELVVTARPIGPALWRIRRGDAEVVILGSISPVPHRPPWDTRRVEAQIVGARQVLIPPTGRVSAADALSIGFTASRLKMPAGQSMRASLPPALRERYDQAIAGHNLKAEKYDSWKPGAAGFHMLADFREQAGFASGKPATTIQKMAKAAGVPVRVFGRGSLMSLFNGAKTLTPAQHLTCLSSALDEIDREARIGRAVAASWSEGDLEAVRQGYPAPALEACAMQAKNARSVIDRGVSEAVSEIESALEQPGRTVVVLDLNFILRRGGVLDRLQSKAEVTMPTD